MSKRIGVLFIFLSCLMSENGGVRAQSSIGFTSNDISIVRNYRLPSWGYQRLELQFNSEKQSDTDKQQSSESSVGQYSISTKPNGYLYQESERLIFRVDARFEGTWSGTDFKWTESPIESEREFKQRKSFVESYILARSQVYIHSDAHISALIINTNNRNKEKNGSEVTQQQDYHNSYYRAGLGWGRMREVSPLIKAMRLAERWKALGHGQIEETTLLKMAQHLSKQGGYRSIFHRPDRRFWKDLYAIWSPENITPDDHEYLKEALLEQFGHHWEGWYIRAGVFKEKSTQKNHPSNNSNKRDSEGLFVEGRWSRHVSMRRTWMIGFDWIKDDGDLGNSYRHNTSRSSGYISHQWLLADRLLYNAGLHLSHTKTEIKNSQTYSNRGWHGIMHHEIDYYLQDRLILNGRIHLNFSENSSSMNSTRRSYLISVGLTALLHRNI
ncbi:hypothetical protein KAR48_04855 [bacterium]|nr:hypothetical protein [bacterium]